MKLTEEQYTAIVAKQKAPKKRAPVQSGQRRLQALGRLKPGQMNKTEQRYADHLEEQKLVGEVLWYAFEAVKLKLSDRTHLTVDFFVMRRSGELEAHDVKGAKAIVTDDARVKMKIAAKAFPWPFLFAYPKKGGGWSVEVV